MSRDVVSETFDVLRALGHSEPEARKLIDAAIATKKKFNDVEALIQAIYEQSHKGRRSSSLDVLMKTEPSRFSDSAPCPTTSSSSPSPACAAKTSRHMPRLRQLTAAGDKATLVPSFPGVTWPVQANMLTGKLPREHGVIANGFYWRDKHEVEMWTAWNEKILAPQIWDMLHEHDPERLTSAVWFPMLSKGCGADYICMPAPIHNPDGSESLWCYTKPRAVRRRCDDSSATSR